jgi:thymidylate synthase ThyX
MRDSRQPTADSPTHGSRQPTADSPLPARRVYCLVGVPPEIQAYAMAKYSRSAQGMLESIQEISGQQAERFLNTFYFQYGHRSIADMAHLVVALENISILAAIRVVDEQLWDGQERSTRYQNFRKSGYEVPAGLVDADSRTLATYTAAADRLFVEYAELSGELLGVLKAEISRPAEIEQQQYERTLRARAFDVARALLPLATRTSVGQVVSARVLERQISRLLGEPYPEVQAIGGELRRSAEMVAESPSVSYPDPIRAAPTLVKYTAPATYGPATYQRLRHVAARLLSGLPTPDRSQTVELADDESPLDELAATLLYRVDAAGHSYRQIQALVRELPTDEKQALVEASFAERGQHDELLREHQSGYAVKFDVLVDLGAFRDLHRHRRCVQIIQDLTPDHGFDDPGRVFERGLGAAAADQAATRGLPDRYARALECAEASAGELASTRPLEAHYLLPLAYRVRALFKMDLAEAAYISELRTAPAGHFSYREVAWQMFEALRERFPAFAATLRVSNPREELNLLER